MVGSRRTRRFPFEGASGPALLRRGEDLTICNGDHALGPWSDFVAATDGADILRGGSGCARPVQHPGRAVSQAARSGGRRSSRRWAAHAQFCVRPERRHGAPATRLLSGENTPESDYVTTHCVLRLVAPGAAVCRPTRVVGRGVCRMLWGGGSSTLDRSYTPAVLRSGGGALRLVAPGASVSTDVRWSVAVTGRMLWGGGLSTLDRSYTSAVLRSGGGVLRLVDGQLRRLGFHRGLELGMPSFESPLADFKIR